MGFEKKIDLNDMEMEGQCNPLHLVGVISDYCPRPFGPSDMVIMATKSHVGSDYDYL
jgi:hypothetical protein